MARHLRAVTKNGRTGRTRACRARVCSVVPSLMDVMKYLPNYPRGPVKRPSMALSLASGTRPGRHAGLAARRRPRFLASPGPTAEPSQVLEALLLLSLHPGPRRLARLGRVSATGYLLTNPGAWPVAAGRPPGHETRLATATRMGGATPPLHGMGLAAVMRPRRDPSVHGIP